MPWSCRGRKGTKTDTWNGGPRKTVTRLTVQGRPYIPVDPASGAGHAPLRCAVHPSHQQAMPPAPPQGVIPRVPDGRGCRRDSQYALCRSRPLCSGGIPGDPPASKRLPAVILPFCNSFRNRSGHRSGPCECEGSRILSVTKGSENRLPNEESSCPAKQFLRRLAL